MDGYTFTLLAIFLPVGLMTIIFAILYAIYVTRVVRSRDEDDEENNHYPRDRVAFFSECGFRGKQVDHRGGMTLSHVHELGMDNVHSIYVPPGFAVTIYSREHFGGERKTLHRSDPCLDDDWAKIKSAKTFARALAPASGR